MSEVFPRTAKPLRGEQILSSKLFVLFPLPFSCGERFFPATLPPDESLYPFCERSFLLTQSPPLFRLSLLALFLSFFGDRPGSFTTLVLSFLCPLGKFFLFSGVVVRRFFFAVSSHFSGTLRLLFVSVTLLTPFFWIV